jgi:transposase
MLRKPESQDTLFEHYFYKVIPEDHLLRRIQKTVDFSFIHNLVEEKYCSNNGRNAKSPELMFKICLLEYLYNLSDVKVVEEIQVNMAFRWFLGLKLDDEVPDDSTISYFRSKRLGEKEFENIFHQIVDQCIKHGLVSSKPGRAIVDATSIIANVVIPSWVKLVQQASQKVIQEIESIKAENAKSFQERLDGLAKDLCGKTNEERLPAYLELAKELAAYTKEISPKDEKLSSALDTLEKVIADRNIDACDQIISIVDTDARKGHKSERKIIHGYKDHIMIDEKSEIITAVKVTPANVEEGGVLTDLINQFEEYHKTTPSELTADKGYCSGKNFRFLNDKEIIAHISIKKSSKDDTLYSPDDFQFDAEKMMVTCPAGETTSKLLLRKDRPGTDFKFKTAQCKHCKLRSKCTKSPQKPRTVYFSDFHFDLKKGREHYRTDKYKEASKQRHKVERRHADQVKNHGLRHSRFIGLERTRIHGLMSAIASNIKRMAKLFLGKFPRGISAPSPA